MGATGLTPGKKNWRMNSAATESTDKELQRKEIEENKQLQRNYAPVAPGIPIQTWRDQEEQEREEQHQFNVTSLGMESKETRRKESE